MTTADPRAAYQAEIAAKLMIDAHRKTAFDRAFSGTHLRKTPASIKNDSKGLAKQAKGLGSAVSKAAGHGLPAGVGAVPVIDALGSVMKIIGLEDAERADFELIMAEELAVLGAKGLIGVAEIFVPYLSTVLAGKDMIKAWANAVTGAHMVFTKSRSARVDMRAGDPLVAAQAVIRVIGRDAQNSAREATIHTVKFSVDVAATAGGFGAGGAAAGAITGAASAGAQLANSLFLLGRDYQEMKAANALLKAGSPPSSEELFGAYPLLGCYLIAGADDSDLLAFFMGEMGGPGWMDKIEKEKKRTLGPLQAEARKAIKASRFELDGFHGSKIKVIIPKRKTAASTFKSFVHRIV